MTKRSGCISLLGQAPINGSLKKRAAAAAAALSLIPIMLDSAFGSTVLSRLIDAGAAAIGIGAIISLTLTDAIASGLGGYLIGEVGLGMAMRCCSVKPPMTS